MLPIRVPIEIGGETANLLVPLYLVIAPASIARILADRERSRQARDRLDPWPQRLRYVLAAGLVLYAIQAAYSEDVSNAVENIGFFLAPFAVLFCLLSEIEWSRGPASPGARGRRRRRARLLADRDLPVLRPRPVPQPRALRRQRAPRLLPGQLDLLRPQHLRPLPGAGDRGATPACIAWGAPAARADRGRGRLRARPSSRSPSATRSPASRRCSPGLAFWRCCAGAARGFAAAAAFGVGRPGRARCSPAARRPATSRTSAASTPATPTSSPAASTSPRTARSGAGARARSAARSTSGSSARGPPSRTPSRSPSPPSRE